MTPIQQPEIDLTPAYSACLEARRVLLFLDTKKQLKVAESILALTKGLINE